MDSPGKGGAVPGAGSAAAGAVTSGGAAGVERGPGPVTPQERPSGVAARTSEDAPGGAAPGAARPSSLIGAALEAPAGEPPIKASPAPDRGVSAAITPAGPAPPVPGAEMHHKAAIHPEHGTDPSGPVVAGKQPPAVIHPPANDQYYAPGVVERNMPLFDSSDPLAAKRAAWERWRSADQGTSYRDNYPAFEQALHRAMIRHQNGDTAVPLVPAGGNRCWADRRFGVELEYELGRTDELAHALHGAGLTKDGHLGSQDAARKGGYSDERDSWKLEFEWAEHRSHSMVEGVSPLSSDDPFFIQELTTLIRISREHGAHTSISTGVHTHVSTYDFGSHVEYYSTVLDIHQTFWPTLKRLARDPSLVPPRRETHCQPNPVTRDYISLNDMVQANSRSGQNEFYPAVNLTDVKGSRFDNVEFRVWSSSLDPGAVQARLKINLGMVEAALRLGFSDEVLMPAQGDGHPFFEFRTLVDLLFQRDVDKEQAVALLVATTPPIPLVTDGKSLIDLQAPLLLAPPEPN